MSDAPFPTFEDPAEGEGVQGAIVVDLEVFEGQHVKRGQVLAKIYSTELSAAQTEFVKAHTQRQAAERGKQRGDELVGHGPGDAHGVRPGS